MKNSTEGSLNPFTLSGTSPPDLKPLFDSKIAGNEAQDEWLSSEEAANYLKIPVGTLRNMTSNGQLPFYKLGRLNRYLRSELKKLLLSNKRGV